MDIVILDLEWNAAYSRRNKGYINEVIEFGAVKCSAGLVQRDTFSCFVKPQVTKHISTLVSDLTSITDETLTDGLSFMQAVRRFRKWAGDSVIFTWGPADILALIENCRYFSGSGEVSFLSRYCDLQKYA
ncbi:MAG: exonuclease domain-containing protein, partial [Acutalibacter sp.]|nr:exonuclease domain-containing protein [Acutalibacter sp.]